MSAGSERDGGGFLRGLERKTRGLSVDFGEDDAKFDIDPTAGSVTQTATANIGNATEKFFKAAIEVDVPDNEDP